MFLCIPQVDLQKETLVNFLSLEVGSTLVSSRPFAELIKGYILMMGGSEGEVERTANTGQHPRQEEGIPSPSFQSCLMRSGAREHPCFFSTAREIC